MIAAWMIVSLVSGVVIALGALALDGASRALRTSRRWTWAGALALLVVLTVVAPLRRVSVNGPVSLPASLPATGASADVGVASPTSVAARTLAAAQSMIDAPVARLVRNVAHLVPASVDHWLLAGWIASSVVLLGLGAAVLGRLRHAQRTWPVSSLHGERVHVAPDAGPAVLGFIRGSIIVPPWITECAADVQAVVVAHEREHVRARDPMLLTLGSVLVVLLPWNPAAWWMLTRLRLAVELDCDRRVLNAGIRTRDYGMLLIDLAGRSRGIPLGAPLVGLTMLAERTTHLERRIVAMSAPRPRLASLRITAGSLVALVAVLAACESHLPTEVEMNSMTAASAERAAANVGLVGVGDTLTAYYVDGYAAGADAAHALSAKQIASVRVVRDSIKSGKGTVWITTRDSGPMKLRSAMYARTVNDTVHVEHMTIRPKTMTEHFAGVILVDGKRIAPSELNTVARSDIKSIEVIKGDRAAELYPNDPAAAQGVIQITTKHGAK